MMMTKRGPKGTRGRPAGSREGSTIVIVVTLIFTLMLSGLVFVRGAATSSESVTAHLADRRAYYLAEAGVHEAFEVLRAGGTGNLGRITNPIAHGGGLLWVESTDLGAQTARVVAVALLEDGVATVETVLDVSPPGDPLFEYVLTSDDLLTLAARVVMDSYDSSLGTYASQATNTYGAITYAKDGADVRSNTDLMLNSDAHVFGDAIPGLGYSVNYGTGAYVSGSTDPAENNFDFPVMDPPSIPSAGPLTVPDASTLTLGPGQHAFDSITINKNATLTVEGPAEIVVTDFTGVKDSWLQIDARQGPVTFYVSGTYTHGNGFETVPYADSPTAVAFMIEGTTDVVFPQGTKVRGAYYVPNASVMFANYCEFWGAMAAQHLQMSADMRFHYDEHLRKYWERPSEDEREVSSVIAWYEAPVPEGVAPGKGDPFEALGITPADTLTIRQAKKLSMDGQY